MDFFLITDYNRSMERSRYSMSEPTIIEKVQEVLDKLRPFLLRDGGDCELVDVEDGIVKLRLLGACGTCPSSTITLKAGIERALFEEVPGVVEVEQVF
ncbi:MULTISPECIES: NifU family protein [Heyndrickxia]|uniref:NifU family protein n=1 Tax=Heyndrickxia TaxID=2837504 RepID=UPI0015E728AA|nr:NifU family protein [Heyndrickxia sporothermodurans]